MSTRSDSMDTPDMPFRQVSMGKVVPNFEGDTLEGPINFYDWLGSSWGILFSHPGPFASICTTEMGAMSAMHNVSLNFLAKQLAKFSWYLWYHFLGIQEKELQGSRSVLRELGFIGNLDNWHQILPQCGGLQCQPHGGWR